MSAFLGTLYFTGKSERSSPRELDVAGPTDLELVASATTQGQLPQKDGELDPQEFEDRRWAIATLARHPSDTTIQSLSHILATSGDHRERLEAITALRDIGSTQEFAGTVKPALLRAAADRNAEVAARARSALAGD